MDERFIHDQLLRCKESSEKGELTIVCVLVLGIRPKLIELIELSVFCSGFSRKVGRVLAVFIDYLAEHGLVLGDLVIVGHSLGAHISGYAGKNIKSGRIGAIIGLDPAGPLFSIDKPQKRLADTDADYVQIIHTDAGNLSVEHPIGHADFYPNGGNEQPGCSKGNALTSYLSEICSYRSAAETEAGYAYHRLLFVLFFFFSEKCSHSKSHAFFLESLQLGVRFPAIQCVSYEEIERNECTVVNQETEFLMGGDLPAGKPRPHGIFYLETNIVPPYAIPDTNEFKAISRSSYS